MLLLFGPVSIWYSDIHLELTALHFSSPTKPATPLRSYMWATGQLLTFFFIFFFIQMFKITHVSCNQLNITLHYKYDIWHGSCDMRYIYEWWCEFWHFISSEIIHLPVKLNTQHKDWRILLKWIHYTWLHVMKAIITMKILTSNLLHYCLELLCTKMSSTLTLTFPFSPGMLGVIKRKPFLLPHGA